jgi:hypothetical protein
MDPSSKVAMTSGMGSSIPCGIGLGIGVMIADLIFIGCLDFMVCGWKTKWPPWNWEWFT